MLYDISPTLSAATPVWPGDTPYRAELTWSIEEGGTVNVSAITTTPHLGSHADAPFHAEADGATIADLPLEPFLGPCRVVEVPPEPLITPEHVAQGPGGGADLADPPRLLLKTGSVRRGSGADGDAPAFPEQFSALSPELARALGEAGALLVGLDTPSVDPFDSEELPAHHALIRGGVVNLEGLVLDDVPPGLYELVALPLKLAGLDASPVRAVLRTV
jgi:arylformamidase